LTDSETKASTTHVGAVWLTVGIDINGKIAIVKYGANFRGLKIKGAQMLHARRSCA
jgi:hypothetical protein